MVKVKVVSCVFCLVCMFTAPMNHEQLGFELVTFHTMHKRLYVLEHYLDQSTSWLH